MKGIRDEKTTKSGRNMKNPVDLNQLIETNSHNTFIEAQTSSTYYSFFQQVQTISTFLKKKRIQKRKLYGRIRYHYS